MSNVFSIRKEEAVSVKVGYQSCAAILMDCLHQLQNWEDTPEVYSELEQTIQKMKDTLYLLEEKY
jgi:hypothetical protein